MDSAGYVSLSRQSGLMSEMRTIAQNIANSSTVGYRAEALVFSEYIKTSGDESVSMATARSRFIDTSQGVLDKTGGVFDFAVEGDGFFRIETDNGERLTRAGNFALNADGEMVTTEGYRVLSADAAPIVIPPGEGRIAVSGDGEISTGEGVIAQLGIADVDPKTLRREGDNLFSSTGAIEAAEDPRVVQGFLEKSNVNPVEAIARMVEVQRAYELGKGMMDREHERMTKLIQTVGRSA
jgi:flagellar basal-body rod protein FlgF